LRHLKNQRGLSVAVCICAIALVVPVVAVAKTKTRYRTVYTNQPVSFSGSCSFAGAKLDFSPGLKIAEAVQTGTVDATGSCGSSGTGHLTGTVTGKANCTGGEGAATGTGTLTVGSTAIPVKLSFTVTLPTGKLVVYGMTSGSGSASAAFLNPNNLGGMPGCVGAGLRHATFAGKLSTSSPITSTVRVAHRVKVTSRSK
jgi:hypothetical protein